MVIRAYGISCPVRVVQCILGHPLNTILVMGKLNRCQVKLLYGTSLQTALEKRMSIWGGGMAGLRIGEYARLSPMWPCFDSDPGPYMS